VCVMDIGFDPCWANVQARPSQGKAGPFAIAFPQDLPLSFKLGTSEKDLKCKMVLRASKAGFWSAFAGLFGLIQARATGGIGLDSARYHLINWIETRAQRAAPRFPAFAYRPRRICGYLWVVCSARIR
jgi:hypothetical protein